jgi:hypothetical protein
MKDEQCGNAAAGDHTRHWYRGAIVQRPDQQARNCSNDELERSDCNLKDERLGLAFQSPISNR